MASLRQDTEPMNHALPLDSVCLSILSEMKWCHICRNMSREYRTCVYIFPTVIVHDHQRMKSRRVLMAYVTEDRLGLIKTPSIPGHLNIHCIIDPQTMVAQTCKLVK